ncbi:ribonuclease HI [Ancylomarina sp. 16SWW S1-10-2]|uniref:ribonuclease HI n=1 Tax=Ancylomarina sp. 16SWW S1-10-2 TaxID=2499681 RepID=UPI0012AE9FC2|nr:RNase H family protein [Ancylomarina sp. 16SWW S1-10-2]MRT93554.1 ribonuclease H [Ancylomarina sp. 16SWW S1-10-2]
MSDEIYLFTDGSVNTKTKIGFGASLIVEDLAISLDKAKELVQLKQFEETSSTKLELQILLDTLAKLEKSKKQVIVYTDSQNIVGLSGRRLRLEKNKYISKNGRLIDNHELYKVFYRITDLLDCKIVKIKGHKISSLKNKIDFFFTLVDRASRNALRESV